MMRKPLCRWCEAAHPPPHTRAVAPSSGLNTPGPPGARASQKSPTATLRNHHRRQHIHSPGPAHTRSKHLLWGGCPGRPGHLPTAAFAGCHRSHFMLSPLSRVVPYGLPGYRRLRRTTPPQPRGCCHGATASGKTLSGAREHPICADECTLFARSLLVPPNPAASLPTFPPTIPMMRKALCCWRSGLSLFTTARKTPRRLGRSSPLPTPHEVAMI
ncbi:hypothetical protein BT67DRAFT_39822 [Trichocladium antarcticum]|uniref:Uncharacterized protein n=1 Tax=Trichocladium antarcticum TaxID=1450529 RepID=A0AAN6UIS6_9PEZI|nr:hypothetical protein BT67DRAFT_39822 [Trichocladium antarcticum]